ncbi:MAG TPA: hypothetical protein VHX59_24220 [Mycobacteriales bacterium]|jgi:hypothetical protein|nr:hypothetical protein [Mycobacteriales bacterium]
MSLMTVQPSIPVSPSRELSFWDPWSGCRIEAHTPAGRPDLWQQYVEGLSDSYRHYDVEGALDLDSFVTGESTSIFFVAFSPDEEIVAGVRMHGPLGDKAEAHAMLEFAADPAGVATVGRLIDDRLPFGVIEMKGGWVARHSDRRSELGNTLARCFLHAMTMLDVQFAFGTASTHAVSRWRTTGARKAEGLSPVAYPDDRYQTMMMWWDFAKLDERADPAQMRRFRSEAAALIRSGIRSDDSVISTRRAHA